MSRGVELWCVVVIILSLQFWNTWVSPTSKISFMQLLVRSPQRHPVLGREFGSIAITCITDAFRRLRYRFPKVSWLCVDGWIQLDVGIASLGEILCFPCIPNTWLHNRKVSGVYKWEFKYLVGYLSNRHMIRYGIYHMFVSGLIPQANPLFCFVLWYSSCFNAKCWFHTLF